MSFELMSTNNFLILSLAAVVTVLAGSYVFLQPAKERKVLKKDEYQKFPLIEKILISHNTALFRFGLPKPTDVLGLPIGQHISISEVINGKEIVRSYTPTSTDEAKGHFDLLIKWYDLGNISKFINELKLGETINVRGPKGFFTYTPNMCREFGMVAGGTGITPMYQIISAIARNPEDNTKVQLIYGNQTEEDILLKDELDAISKQNPNIKIHYILDRPTASWTGGSGYVTPEMMSEHLPKASDDVQLLLCGPPRMTATVKSNAVDLGYKKAKPVSKLGDQIFVF
ncbi:unnamed protein product [Kuraishia capsulata CBS 1993]|uniref:NADH-cytochrome b5 reductase n=1 Tax=Kuraishia capsulata CBS 1993 TaxID=1382522 RepID=W6MIM1_9ASCO|nr:uncharacterized protein KUCA_T00002300001 [Kuraishia capsulata CBS 1993]CDK26329.1 unnamed protein product [Kuraishia capsulata CBS 1993]